MEIWIIFVKFYLLRSVFIYSHYLMDQLEAFRTTWRDPDCISAICND